MTRAALVVLALSGCTQLPYTGGALPVTPIALDRHWLRAADTPIIKQHHERDCGLAALAMVAGSWGRHWSIDDLARQLPPTSHGIRLGSLRDFARAHGFEAYTIPATMKDLARELGAGRPMILGLVLPFDRGHNQSHYEVAIAMEPRSGTVITIDPASGRWVSRTRAVLDLEWKSAEYAALVVTRTSSTPMSHTRPTSTR
jgi:ABC-type bacteriocin/lantibiotic exporter with double-glycine peptidase domain